VREYAQMHGGHAEVVPHDGRGARLRVVLPTNRPMLPATTVEALPT